MKFEDIVGGVIVTALLAAIIWSLCYFVSMGPDEPPDLSPSDSAFPLAEDDAGTRP